MYYDDIFHPTNNDDDCSMTSASYTIGSRASVGAREHYKNYISEAKKADKGYYCYYKRYNGRLSKIEMYNSGNSTGYRIRDPSSGVKLNSRVGSHEETFFFKIRMCGLNRENPVTLFYDTPEHFERHQKIELSDSVKQKWWEARSAPLLDIPIHSPNDCVVVK
jgi:hypothetical protein